MAEMYTLVPEDGPEGTQLVRNYCPLPLVEGKCPPQFNSKTKEWYYPEPDLYYRNPAKVDTDTYYVDGMEEFWGYVTHCKACGAEFQAYLNDDSIRNYCPGCGKKLT